MSYRPGLQPRLSSPGPRVPPRAGDPPQVPPSRAVPCSEKRAHYPPAWQCVQKSIHPGAGPYHSIVRVAATRTAAVLGLDALTVAGFDPTTAGVPAKRLNRWGRTIPWRGAGVKGERVKGQVWTRHYAPAAPASTRPSSPSQFHFCPMRLGLFHPSVLLPSCAEGGGVTLDAPPPLRLVSVRRGGGALAPRTRPTGGGGEPSVWARTPPPPGVALEGGGGGGTPALWCAQPMPSHCLLDAKCQLQWHL